jgi:hypothetical protein
MGVIMHAAASNSPSVQRVVERQLRNWEIQREQSPSPRAKAPLKVHPYVAISREAGSGAMEVARLLSTRLRWPLFDKEILEHMGADDAVRKRMYHLMDERGEDWLDDILRPLTLGPRALRNDYFRRLRASVGTITAQESAIFVGRGAGLLLQPDAGLHVRFVAPREARAARLAQRHGIDATEASKFADQTDRDRLHFLESHFGPDPHRPERFDLTINTARLNVNQAVEVIHGALKAKFPSLAI